MKRKAITIESKFKERLKEQRKKHGHTQQFVAKEFCVSQVTISNWERGVKEPSFDKLLHIAHFFGKTTDYMLGVGDYER